jgi:hypothetical protein
MYYIIHKKILLILFMLHFVDYEIFIKYFLALKETFYEYFYAKFVFKWLKIKM